MNVTPYEKDAALFTESLFSLPKEMLASYIALCRELSVGKLVYDKISGFFSGNKNRFQSRVEATSRRLSSGQESVLALHLLMELNAALGVRVRNYLSIRDFNDNAEELVKSSITLLRSEEPEFTGKDLREMAVFYTSRMFRDYEEKFNESDEDEQGRMVSQLREYLQKVPEEQREKIRQTLNVEELSDSVIRQTIRNGAMGTAFAGMVSLGGFSFYTGAVSLLAGAAGLIGITLPFKVYVGLTSLIAVLANPVVLIAMVMGGGIWFTRRKNRKLRERVIPMIVSQVFVAGYELGDSGKSVIEGSLAVWGEAYENMKKYRGEYRVAQDNYSRGCDELQSHKNRLSKLKNELSVASVGETEEEKRKVPRLKSDIAQLKKEVDARETVVSGLEDVRDKAREAKNRAEGRFKGLGNLQ